MLNRVIDWSAGNRFVVFALVAAAALAGWWSLRHIALDAIPDLGDPQVIVYSQWDRSPDIIEDQVTFPIVTALLGAPGVTAVRGLSDFGSSYVYVVFDEGTDIYWARARTAEYLAAVTPALPPGVTTRLGPDATSLGWVFQYALVDDTGARSLADLRAVQDSYVGYHLRSVPGVAEVAAVGGFTRQYQIIVDPDRLRLHSIPLSRVVEAVRGSNMEVGGRLIEVGGTEYMVRGRGYATSARDFANVVVSDAAAGATVRVSDVGEVVLGPDLRRGIADLDGGAEVVSGIVVMRHGQNALEVVERVKDRLLEIEPGLPAGVKVVGGDDRSDLIQRAIDTLKSTLLEIVIVVAAVVLLMLRHVPSALIAIVSIPLAMLISFIPFGMMGITANIMSLAGIAIAIGTLVDAAIVVAEQTHRKLEAWQRDGRPGPYQAVVLQAVKEVAPVSFFALLVLAVSFLPVLTLEAQEGQLFKPLAYTKTLAIVVAALLVVTLDPALRLTFTRVQRFAFRPSWVAALVNVLFVGHIHEEKSHPVSRFLIRVYEPVVWWTLRSKWVVLGGALVLFAATVPVFLNLGGEFMPPFDEGTLLYMPSTVPGLSVGEAQRLLQRSDQVLKTFTEVERVLGKAGRAQTATDPAPLSMLETVIVLKPQSEWRTVPTWYSEWAPRWLVPGLSLIWPNRLSTDALVAELDRALSLPGVSNAWTMPIKGRTDMLTTGIRSPIGLKVTGPDRATLESLSAEVETVLRDVPGTRHVLSERVGSGMFLDVRWDREQLARNGLSIETAQSAVQNAIGGEDVTVAVEGRARYPVNVRYMRDFRDTVGAIEKVLVPVGDQGHVRLSDLATVEATAGPSMIRTENGLPTTYVYLDVEGRDPHGYIDAAAAALRLRVRTPPGYALLWSGQYEAMARVSERLWTVIPLTLLLVVVLLYLSTRSAAKTAIICTAVPFSLIGAVWFLYLLDYNLSIAVWVGLIALIGLDAETGRFMLLYLDLAHDQARREGRLGSLAALREAIVEGAAKRVRPKFMTVTTTMLGLVPIMWASGAGSDVMKRIAAPMIGGLVTSFLLELLVYPALYECWQRYSHPVGSRVQPVAALPSGGELRPAD